MKKIIFSLIFIASSVISAQALNAKWVNVIDMPDQKIYVDSSTIKKFDNQISVLSISYFTEPQKNNSIAGDIYIIKSQLLFNLALQKYTSIGNLYYNKNLKILGESSLPGFSTNSDNFAIPIDSNPSVYAIYSFCLNLINKDERVIAEKDFSRDGSRTKAIPEPGEFDKSKTESAQSNVIVDKQLPVSVKDKKTDADNPIAKKQLQAENTVEIINKSKDNKDDAFTKLSEKKKELEQPATESNPKTTIFSDGNKYSFQVSSWKNKSKAESEMRRLIKKGHNAFIASAFIPERKGTWYRVRIGHFNSIEETEEYMKKLK